MPTKPPQKTTTASSMAPLPPLPHPKSEEEEKILRVLKALLKTLSYTHRKVEDTLGLSRGTLSRLFKGTIPLKFSHVTGICRMAELDLREFFRLVFLRPSRPLPSTNPADSSDPSLPKYLAVILDWSFTA